MTHRINSDESPSAAAAAEPATRQAAPTSTHPPHTHPFTRPFPTNPFARQGSRGPDPQPPTTTHPPRPAAQQGTGLLQALFYFFSEGRGTFFQCRPYWHTPDDSCSWGEGEMKAGGEGVRRSLLNLSLAPSCKQPRSELHLEAGGFLMRQDAGMK